MVNGTGTVRVSLSDGKACAPASVPAVSGRTETSVEAGVGEDADDAGTCALRSCYC